MPPQQAAVQPTGAAAGNGQGQQRQQQSWGKTAIQCIFIWFFARQFFGGKPKSTPANRQEFFLPAFNKSELLDMRLYLSDAPAVDPTDGAHLIWTEERVPLAVPGDRGFDYVYHPSKAAHNNGTVYLHAYFVRSGLPLDPSDPQYDPHSVFTRSHPLSMYLPAPRNKTGVNLLSGQNAGGQVSTQEAEREASAQPREIISYLKPNISIQLVDDFQTYGAQAIPAQLAPQMDLDPMRMEYNPTVFFNEFWLLKDHLIPLNETVREVPLHLSVGAIGNWKWMIFTQMEQSFSMQKSWGAMNEGESDDLKRVLLEGNPWYLGLTFCVSLLHSVFDFFAFKNDIGFWRNKKSVEGLSVRTILINAFCQLIIFLYLLDSETSTVILFSSGIGCAIEFWKVTQAMNVSIDRSGAFPMLKFEDKAGYSTATNTKKHDADAIKYLSWVLYPLIACYAVYALIYETHRSWYSWILGSLVGAVYTFGFILMCPQLYINYKLKSVAALPWRQMSYKFLNTIIDDLFAFVIKMPLLHRLSVFRDDVIFLIYIYQRWIYRVDKRRANEFGYSEEPDASEAAAVTAAPADTPAQEEHEEAVTGTADGDNVTEDGFVDLQEEALQQRRATQHAAGLGPSSAGLQAATSPKTKKDS